MAQITPINGLRLDLPEILNIPQKLLPMVTRFNEFRYFLIEGGRGSGKSHSVARFILYLCEQRKLRVVCGRELQNNIEESVFTLLKDIISSHGLAFDIFTSKGNERIVHKVTGSEIKFKGFREQGNVSVKGLEGVDILWIDEAQSITKNTLDIIIPTIRKDNARIFFTMNRFLMDDAVPEFLIGRPDCLHIQINYFENPHCPLTLKNEAEISRRKSRKDYEHIWLGMPLRSASEALFDLVNLHNCYKTKPFGDLLFRQRVLGIDFAAQGDDQCVATVLDRMSNQHWEPTERIAWDEPNTMISVGKIVAMIGEFKPDITVLDIGGMGKPVYDRLLEVKMDIRPYDGGSTEGVDTRQFTNIRSMSYHTTKEWVDNGWLILKKERDGQLVKEMEKIWRLYQSNGAKAIEPKVKMKKRLKYSPDNADSLNMAIWGAVTQLGKPSNTNNGSGSGSIVRKNQSNRHG